MHALVSRIDSGKSIPALSQWFHHSLIKSFVHIADLIRQETKINKIVLSGGVFQNHLLFEELIQTLEQGHFEIYTHRQVPSNDGGLALGQIAVGRKFLSF